MRNENGNQSIGVIDIGSNSVHLVVGMYHAGEYYSIVDDVKVNVRLCEGLSETGMLSEERMALGVETLGMFKRMCDTYQLDQIRAVATAAVRKADNGGEFCRRVADEVGIQIEIIPGEMEATYDYLGTINTIAIQDALMMDIGGGSAEFVLIKDRQKLDAISLPFGSIDLAEKFGLKDHITPEALDRLDAFLEGAFSQYPIFRKAKGLPLLGVGGTIRNIGRNPPAHDRLSPGNRPQLPHEPPGGGGGVRFGGGHGPGGAPGAQGPVQGAHGHLHRRQPGGAQGDEDHPQRPDHHFRRRPAGRRGLRIPGLRRRGAGP